VILRTLAERDERVLALELLRNFGQASATVCGLRHAQGRFLITLDDDLQNPPEEIPMLLEHLRSDPELDVVIGIPDEKRHEFWRRLGSKIVSAINSFSLRKPRALGFSGFRAMRRLVADQLVERNVPRPALGALLYSTTPRIANVLVGHEPRTAGQSGYTLPRLLSQTLSNFLAFSDFPLRFTALIGAVGIVVSSAVGTRIVERYLQVGVVVPGWLTLALLLVGISGYNFFAFGLIGEYLLRVLQSVQHTPQYVVRQKVETEVSPEWQNGASE
jgi:glycosyltransferase involved in cell wall biosynthesis